MASDATHTKEVASGHIMDGTLMWCGMQLLDRNNVFLLCKRLLYIFRISMGIFFIKFHLKHLFFFVSKCEYSSVLFIKFNGHKEEVPPYYGCERN